MVAMVAFNLPIARGNKIHCLDILHALVKHVLGQIDDSEEFRKVCSPYMLMIGTITTDVFK